MASFGFVGIIFYFLSERELLAAVLVLGVAIINIFLLAKTYRD
jgi:hypothetical protein